MKPLTTNKSGEEEKKENKRKQRLAGSGLFMYL
jgi:hypothetical protein